MWLAAPTIMAPLVAGLIVAPALGAIAVFLMQRRRRSKQLVSSVQLCDRIGPATWFVTLLAGPLAAEFAMITTGFGPLTRSPVATLILWLTTAVTFAGCLSCLVLACTAAASMRRSFAGTKKKVTNDSWEL